MIACARHLPGATRRAQAPFGFRGPLGGGVLGGLSKPPLVPISDAFWASGGWWDLQNIPGANNAIFSAAVPPTSATGLGVFTPAQHSGALPTIYDQAIGGKRGLVLSQVSDNFLQNDALAAILNGTNKQWSFFVDAQPNVIGVSVVTNTLLGWGSDLPGSNQDALLANYNVIGGGATAQGMTILQSTGGHLTNTQNNIIPALGYDYFRLALSYDGAALSAYINGALVTVTPSTWQTAAMAITRFIWGAWPVSGIGFQGFNGYIRRLGVRALPTTGADQITVDANMVANDAIFAQSDPRTPQFLVAGASVINGSSDEITGMGVRYTIAKYIQDRKLSYQSLGTASGAFALRGTTAVSAANAAQIAAQVASVVTSRTRLVIVDLGDEEIDLGQTAAQVQAAITSALQAIRTSCYAVNPNCRVVVNTIIPLSEAPANAVCGTVNAALPGIWDASDAGFPNNPLLLRWDANTAIGGPNYVQANYGAGGNDHPNNLGYTLMGAAMMAAIGPVVTALSPTK